MRLYNSRSSMAIPSFLIVLVCKRCTVLIRLKLVNTLFRIYIVLVCKRGSVLIRLKLVNALFRIY